MNNNDSHIATPDTTNLAILGHFVLFWAVLGQLGFAVRICQCHDMAVIMQETPQLKSAAMILIFLHSVYF